MSITLTRIKRDLKRDIIEKDYINKNRYIPHELYTELKSKNKCDKCKKYSRKLEIHHKISIKDGGTNNKENLMVLCIKCHRNIHNR